MITDNHEIMFWAYVEEFKQKYFSGEPRAIFSITITFDEFVSSLLQPEVFFEAIEEAGKQLGYVLHDKVMNDTDKHQVEITFTNSKGAIN